MRYETEIDLSLVEAVVIYFIANFGVAPTLHDSCKTMQKLRKKIIKKLKLIRTQKDVTQKQEE